ncbi:hypothetical protein [Ancylobacter sp. G4_0304]|uniref:hypothetical protein n=1 Tax=Ancylobacter sp. G4_0304 TaxID=3114289 RepID=UPI0039C5D98B
MTPTFIKSHLAAAAIAPYRILKLDATGVSQAAAATADIVGVSDSMGADAGKMADVIQGGWAEVEYGGNVVAGKPLTADAQGRAIQATAGAGVRIIGFAQAGGALGDIGAVLFAPGYFSA